MTLVLSFLLIAFGAAGVIGWWRFNSRAWNRVDVVYYPLAAIGVALLFANNAAQRQLLDLNQVFDDRKAELVSLAKARPEVQLTTSDALVDSSLQSMDLLVRWQRLCSEGATDPRCPVARKLGPPAADFLQVSRSAYPTQEERIFAMCAAADRMLDDISRNDGLSRSSADRLLSFYKALISRNYRVFDYEAIGREIASFESDGLAENNRTHRAVFPVETETSGQVLKLFNAEVEFSALMLRGLFPCITAPGKKLSLLSQWSRSKNSQEQEIRRIDAERQRLKDGSAADPRLLRLHLGLWPLVLISALSLKFAKGVATLRKSMKPASPVPPVPKPGLSATTDSAGSPVDPLPSAGRETPPAVEHAAQEDNTQVPPEAR